MVERSVFKEEKIVNAPYSVVLIKPRLNPRRTARLVAAGIDFNVRSTERNREIVEHHAAEARELGRDGYRGQRTDATGQRQADSGTPVFGWQGAKHEATTLSCIVTDLQTAGYVMTGVWLQQKEGDIMSALNLKFEPKGTAVTVSKEAQLEIKITLAQSWRFMHVYRNPNGSATVNPSHLVGEQEINQVTGPRALRMRVDGSFHNECVQVGL
jgi:hypothetical protein